MAQFLTSQVIQRLITGFPEQAYVDVSLAKYSRWRVGGTARCMVLPASESEFLRCVRLCHDCDISFVILGATSNLLFSDQGLGVLGISLARLNSVQIEGNKVVAQAGNWVPHFARKLASEGLSGLEHIVGIPGSLGGLLYMNGGSQRKGIGSHVLGVKTVNRRGEELSYTQDECEFAYRHSGFQAGEEIIFEVEFQLAAEAPEKVRSEMLSILRSRRKKFPLRLPNCGSVFVSNPAMYEEYGPPGAVIESCKLKGVSIGGAQVSPEHANFIVNNGGATALDILKLIKKVQAEVHKRTGYNMVSEVRYMAENGDTRPAATVESLC